MKTKATIIEELNQVQKTCNCLIMDIGQGYAKFRLSNNNSLMEAINQKIEEYKKAELQLKELEKELSNLV